MSVEHALTIQGFTDEPELVWLSERAEGLALVIEFGAWRGRSTAALASARAVVSVDTWLGSAEHQDEVGSGVNLADEWTQNVRRYANVRRFLCDLADPEDLIEQFAGMASMVFVDAAHDYQSVCRDIQTACALLQPAGLLAGHDYSPQWPGVVRAVKELVPGAAVIENGTIWYAP